MFIKYILSYSELLLGVAVVWGGGLMKGYFVTYLGERVCSGLLLNSTHSHPLNNHIVSCQNTRLLHVTQLHRVLLTLQFLGVRIVIRSS